MLPPPPSFDPPSDQQIAAVFHAKNSGNAWEFLMKRASIVVVVDVCWRRQWLWMLMASSMDKILHK